MEFINELTLADALTLYENGIEFEINDGKVVGIITEG